MNLAQRRTQLIERADTLFATALPQASDDLDFEWLRLE